MSAAFDLLVRGGTIVQPHGLRRADLLVRDGRIAAIGDDLGAADTRRTFDAGGLHVLPGLIDPQVHFREPGGEHKEDLETGTTAAALGGITAVFEMPNTNPPTTDRAAFDDKLERARGRARVDHAFFVGATGANAAALAELEMLPGCAGVKIFMGSSTGSLLVADDEGLAAVLASGRRRVAVHCEDEERLLAREHLAKEAGHVRAHPEWRDAEVARRATERLLRLARKHGRLVHVLHCTTAEELDLVQANRDLATVEVPPQHLVFAAPEIYEELGTRAQMNPPIREARHRDALWDGIRSGLVDAVATDHAPHTLEEKAKTYPRSPSGMPGVQTILPVMLEQVHRGRLSLERLVDLMAAGPARIYGLLTKGRLVPGADADLTVVDLEAVRTLRDADMASRAGWTPFDGLEVHGFPVATIVRGEEVMRDAQLVDAPAVGRPVIFAGQGGDGRG